MGKGILATGPLSATETRSAIQEIRRLAPEKPFGVGVSNFYVYDDVCGYLRVRAHVWI